ncbi:MAG: DUF167 domain-containing protein [Candidatus Omnitrophica bacterium]|nr:DUF167 domain-containing protein [Candidatus Omnitrophota bacterium]
MKIFVKVKPKAKQEKIEKISESQFRVWVKEPPQQGRANKKVIELVADYFNIAKSKVKIVSGISSKQKCIEILTYE